MTVSLQMDHRLFWAELRNILQAWSHNCPVPGVHPCAMTLGQVHDMASWILDPMRSLSRVFPGFITCLSILPDDLPDEVVVSYVRAAFEDLTRASVAIAGYGAGLPADQARAREERLRVWYPELTDERLDAWTAGPRDRYRCPLFMAADAKQALVSAYLNMDESGPRLMVRDRRTTATKPTLVQSLAIKDNGYMTMGRVTFHATYTTWRSLSGVLELTSVPAYAAKLPHERLDTLKEAAIRAVLQHWHAQTPAQRAIFNKLLADRAVHVPRKRARSMTKEKPSKRQRRNKD